MQDKDSTLRERLHTIIFRSDTPAGRKFDMLLLGLILTSILLVFLESVTQKIITAVFVKKEGLWKINSMQVTALVQLPPRTAPKP
ncbi:MAG: hypothetical protein EOO01_42175 [Chitinophagaceae bacterium]|nr:MAG: hypothetical protein EOO01_42175 [Chitinophagaceae bacterium]